MEQENWAEMVFSQLKSELPMREVSKVFFHAEHSYRRHLTRLLESQGIECIAPLERPGISSTLHNDSSQSRLTHEVNVGWGLFLIAEHFWGEAGYS